jgi:hypothetical protein
MPTTGDGRNEAQSWRRSVEATQAEDEATDADLYAAKDEADFDRMRTRTTLGRRIVQLSHSGSRSVRDTDDTDVTAEAMTHARRHPHGAQRRGGGDGAGAQGGADGAPARADRRRARKEPAFDRILEETNTKMADREGTRRRSAIAHLKAAVAATKADRMLKRERSRELDEEEQRAYREDLAKVVRPRRSEPREIAREGAARFIEETGAPLILASSQRVDSETESCLQARPAPAPRRARACSRSTRTSFEDHEGDDDSEFAAFAESVGARDLPDLLEAAAAYTAFVERQPSFSRPQIMRRAAAIETDEEFTREAGLRSFGQLLRQGKIRKLQRGQFTISENTRFRPEARIAGE